MAFTVCELFAGVGGFHLGLEKSGWNVIWANQWEPGKKLQHAANCYRARFSRTGTILENDDIAKVKDKVPKHDLLVGGFPCQDYSVASSMAGGIQGKKGVLWWDIYDILKKNKTPYVLLENVDRLLRSSVKQRGRDFGIILACLNLLGYAVEWRVINAADYGFFQRRRRTFIFATRDEQVISNLYDKAKIAPEEVILSSGFFAPKFPIEKHDYSNECSLNSVKTEKDLEEFSNSFEHHFFNAGIMVDGAVYSKRVHAKATRMNRGTLRMVIQKNVSEEYYVPVKDVFKKTAGKKSWEYCKGAKDEPRKNDKPNYKEGAIPFPDNLDMPSRTILTSEGSLRPNRMGHLILDPYTNKYRSISPEEAELLNGFPKGWTAMLPERWRYFCMGNALVVGLIEGMGARLKYLIDNPLPKNISQVSIKKKKRELVIA